LASRAEKEIKKACGLACKAIDSRSLNQEAAISGASAMVISSCLENAKEINGISVTLRDVQPQGNISYLVPVFKADLDQDRKRIKSNLTFGENSAGTFSLFSIFDINAPENPVLDSWSAELIFLREFQAWLDREEEEVPEYIQERIDLLADAPSIGLVDNLFWQGLDGNELEIRSDFTLLNTEGGDRKVSQADIFVVISALLRTLRNRDESKGKLKLTYGPYKRSVLSPNCFERFTDGVIQAAILRAARGYELSYANCESGVNTRMRDVIMNLLNGTSSSAQAIPEFLLALALGKLTLYQEQKLEIFDAVSASSNANQESKLLARYLRVRMQ
jgi:hypothetical protein